MSIYSSLQVFLRFDNYDEVVGLKAGFLLSWLDKTVCLVDMSMQVGVC